MPLMTVDQLLARARSVAGRKIRYKLGAGGMVADAPTPANIDGACDCSGFTSWALGISRRTDHPLYQRFNGGWINTDAMVHDASQATGFFSRLAEPVVGALIVYPRIGKTVGHVGIVTKVAGGAVSRVIHCSSGNFRNFGDAIRETPPTVFQRPQAILAWYEGLTPP